MLGPLATIIKFALALVGVVLLLTAHAFVAKMERTGCECAKSKHHAFIKTYPLVAVAWLVFVVAIPASWMVASPPLFMLLGALHVAFMVATIVFYVIVFQYTGHLMKVKCACSEDARRELLYVWSILQLVQIGILVIVPIAIKLAMTTGAVARTTYDDMRSASRMVEDTVRNPFKYTGELPAAVSKQVRRFT